MQFRVLLQLPSVATQPTGHPPALRPQSLAPRPKWRFEAAKICEPADTRLFRLSADEKAFFCSLPSTHQPSSFLYQAEPVTTYRRLHSRGLNRHRYDGNTSDRRDDAGISRTRRLNPLSSHHHSSSSNGQPVCVHQSTTLPRLRDQKQQRDQSQHKCKRSQGIKSSIHSASDSR